MVANGKNSGKVPDLEKMIHEGKSPRARNPDAEHREHAEPTIPQLAIARGTKCLPPRSLAETVAQALPPPRHPLPAASPVAQA
jgi:hypothetical protein